MGGKTVKAPRRTVDGIQEKECTSCKTFKPEGFDHFFPQNKGFAAECRICAKVRNQLRRKEEATPTPKEPFTFPPMKTTDEELTGSALAKWEQGEHIVRTFNAYHALDLLTYGWGRATQAAHG